MQLKAAKIFRIATDSHSSTIFRRRCRGWPITWLLGTEVITLERLSARLLVRGVVAWVHGTSWPGRRTLLSSKVGWWVGLHVVLQPFEFVVWIRTNLTRRRSRHFRPQWAQTTPCTALFQGLGSRKDIKEAVFELGDLFRVFKKRRRHAKLIFRPGIGHSAAPFWIRVMASLAQFEKVVSSFLKAPDFQFPFDRWCHWNLVARGLHLLACQSLPLRSNHVNFLLFNRTCKFFSWIWHVFYNRTWKPICRFDEGIRSPMGVLALVALMDFDRCIGHARRPTQPLLLITHLRARLHSKLVLLVTFPEHRPDFFS